MDPYKPPPPTERSEPHDERDSLHEWIGKPPNGDQIVAFVALLFIASVFALSILGAMVWWAYALYWLPQ